MSLRIFTSILTLALVLTLFTPFPTSGVLAAPTADDPDLLALLNARATAETSLSAGEHVAALDVLLQSLRVAPPERPELADVAYGNGQMVSYVLLHLMPEPAAYAYLEKGFDPVTYETDKMVKVLCTIAIGLNNEDKTAQSREATYLTTSKNQIVRMITMFYLSNPYFYDNPDFTGQYAEMLAQEVPDLELTQTSLNLSLYASSELQDLPDISKDISKSGGKAQAYKPWSKSLRARIRDCAKNFDSKTVLTRSQALAPLLRGVTEASDWRERHFSLLLMKKEFDGPIGNEMRDAARELAHRPENTPDVLQARVLLADTLSSDAGRGRDSDAVVEEAVSVAEILIEEGVDETTPERVMWETWAYGIRDCAKNLAAAGRDEEAIGLYASLAEKLPGSKIATACNEARAELIKDDPSLQSTAR